MKLNLEEQEETIEPVEKTDLIYGIDDRPPFKEALFAALQHLLAIFVAIITPPLIIAGALKLDLETTGFLVSMALFASGVSTFIQCRRIGPVGAKLLCIQGTSFSFIGPIITAGLAGGLPLIFGACIAAAPIEMVISRTFKYMRSIITPLVSGIVVLLIGLTLIKVGLISMGGGYTAMQDNTFANADNLIMSCTVLGIIILLNRIRIIWVKSSAILIALVIGYILAGFMGHLNFSVLQDAPLIQIPTPMHFGLSFSWSLFIPMAFIYLVTSLEAIGDVTATSKISNQPVDGPIWMQRIKGGVLVNGANSFLAGIFNTFPSSVFAQNNGVIQLTGVASRYVGIWIAILLVILGLFPAVAAVIQAVPQAVLGGAVMVMFGAVAASGINILASIQLDRRALLIIAISLALGLGVAQVPQILEHLPELFKNIFSSGVATGGIAALILNIVLPETHK